MNDHGNEHVNDLSSPKQRLSWRKISVSLFFDRFMDDGNAGFVCSGCVVL